MSITVEILHKKTVSYSHCTGFNQPVLATVNNLCTYPPVFQKVLWKTESENLLIFKPVCTGIFAIVENYLHVFVVESEEGSFVRVYYKRETLVFM